MLPRSSDVKWYAIYTKHKFERKVAQQINDMQIEAYCPLNKVVRQWSDRKKIIEVPLFNSYVFVRSTEREHAKVKEIEGVLNYVYWIGKPAVIKDEEIDIIKKFLKDYQNVQVEDIKVNINDKVRITGGPLLFKEGIVTEIHNKTVKVYLPTLGLQMQAQVEKAHVELVKHQF